MSVEKHIINMPFFMREVNSIYYLPNAGHFLYFVSRHFFPLVVDFLCS